MPFKLELGFVSGESELHLVEQICADAKVPAIAKISAFPGIPLTRDALAFDGELIVRIMDEDRDGSGPDKPMMPLKTAAAISDMQRRFKITLDSCKQAKNIRHIFIGNETDIGRYWGGKQEEFGPHFAKHVVQIVRDDGYIVGFDGPQANTANWRPYMKGLRDARCIDANTWLSIHPYQQTAVMHLARLDGWINDRENRVWQFPTRRAETECGLKLSGAIEFQVSEIKLLYDGLRTRAAHGIINLAMHYRISENNAPESKPSPFKADKSKHPVWYDVMVEQLRKCAA